ncbi:hypothetical protein [Streptomyces sp. LaBMicrA B280]|uniref:hypothetical protein n=1 Tax=Streptomyces sp. LaBMicrA B280 TaxID=3391001 RepID=UPI003BA42557
MNATSAAVATAVTFVRLGIGRTVFRALNTVEAVLAVVVSVAVAVDAAPARIIGPTVAAAVLLPTQLAPVRPCLNRRSDRVLAGEDLPRSRGHLWYVALELLKAAALLTA